MTRKKARKVRVNTTPKLVTVTGRISTTYLRAGEQVEVVLTEQVQHLADEGYVTIEPRG